MTDVLDAAGFVDRRDQLQIARSPWELGICHSRRLSPNVRNEYALRWQVASRAQAVGVIAWIETYLVGGAFDYTPPGGTSAKFVLAEDRYSYRRSAGFVEIEVPIRRALAYD